MREIYELRYSAELRCLKICIKFNEIWFRHSKVNRRETQAHGQARDLISLL
jgi:hypothetical protein